MAKKTDIFFLLLLLILGVFATKALFHPGFYTNHDGEHQVIRLWHFHKGLIDGQFPVRWAGTLLNGFGYPLFVFTYRLPFWLGELFLRSGLSLTDSIKAVFVLTYLLSGLSMYLFSKNLWKDRLIAFFCALLYLWAPYRFSNIFVRASLGDHTTFIFLPLIFLAIIKLREEKKKKLAWIFLGSLSIVGLILSHLLIFQLFLSLLVLFYFLSFLISVNKKSFLISIFLMTVLAVSLSTYYWFPLMQSKKITKGFLTFHYADHFPTIRQLLYSKWDYGFSLPGENDGMAFQLGVVHWLVIFLAVFFLFIQLMQSKKKFKNWNALFFLILFLISLFFSLEISSEVWGRIAHKIVIDYPWRLLAFLTFFSSILTGFVLSFFKKKAFIIYHLSFIILFCLNLYANRNHLRVNKYLFFDDNSYKENKGTSNTYNEYTPYWVDSLIVAKEKAPIEILSGKGKIEKIFKKSNLLTFKTASEEEMQIRVNTIYFPGWQVFADGKTTPFDYKDGGVIKFFLQAGEHNVKVIFSEPKVWLLADFISLMALLLVIFFMGKKFLWLEKK